MKKILFILAILITMSGQCSMNIYDIQYDIDQYLPYIKIEKPKTFWSYLFIDRKLKFKLQLNPTVWFSDSNNLTVPVNYWCFKVIIKF
jgi:hypothetical protein